MLAVEQRPLVVASCERAGRLYCQMALGSRLKAWFHLLPAVGLRGKSLTLRPSVLSAMKWGRRPFRKLCPKAVDVWNLWQPRVPDTQEALNERRGEWCLRPSACVGVLGPGVPGGQVTRRS